MDPAEQLARIRTKNDYVVMPWETNPNGDMTGSKWVIKNWMDQEGTERARALALSRMLESMGFGGVQTEFMMKNATMPKLPVGYSEI